MCKLNMETELVEAINLMQGFKPCQKNINSIIDVVTIGDLNSSQVLNKYVTYFGGTRWVAIMKLAQAIVSGQVVNNNGILEVNHV